MRARLNSVGFTTVELMVALVLAGIVTAAISAVLRRQQRFYTNAASLVEQRVALRDITGILPGELRALSPAGGDVLAFSDSALDLRATIGTAIACDTVAVGGAIALAPVSGRGAPLSSFTTAPQAGDVALVYDAGESDRPDDDAWFPLAVADVAWSPSVCVGSPFASSADASTPPMVVRFGAGSRVPPTVRPGAFVRLLRRVRYRFYRAGTGDWYLGYSEWSGAGFTVVQPVGGPFAAYSARGPSGVALRYFDENGVELFDSGGAARIARVRVAARGVARGTLSGTRPLTDSQAVGVRVRNR
jgi:hypothetical protein